MVQNIIAGIMTAIAIAAGVFGWWMDNINVVEHEISPGIDSQRNSNDGTNSQNDLNESHFQNDGITGNDESHFQNVGITENSVNMKNDTREEK